MKEKAKGKHSIDNIFKCSFFSGTGNWSFPKFKVQNTIPVQVVIQEYSSHEKEMLAVGSRNNPKKGVRVQTEALPSTVPMASLFYLWSNLVHNLMRDRRISYLYGRHFVQLIEKLLFILRFMYLRNIGANLTLSLKLTTTKRRTHPGNFIVLIISTAPSDLPCPSLLFS